MTCSSGHWRQITEKPLFFLSLPRINTIAHQANRGVLYYLPGNASEKAQKGSQQPLPCGVLRSPVFYQRKWLVLAWLSTDLAPWLYPLFAMIFCSRRVDSQKPLGFDWCPQLDLLWALYGLFILHLPAKCSDAQYFSYEYCWGTSIFPLTFKYHLIQKLYFLSVCWSWDLGHLEYSWGELSRGFIGFKTWLPCHFQSFLHRKSFKDLATTSIATPHQETGTKALV